MRIWAMVFALTWTTVARGDVRGLLDVLKRTGSLTIAGEPVCATGALQNFYHRRHDEPAWTDANAAALIRAIERSEEEGLDAQPYHVAGIAKAEDADRDILLTDAFLLYGTHLLQGRVDPQSLIPAWCIEPRRIDLPAVLQAALEDGTVEQALARLAPRSDGYTRLRAALASCRTIAANGGWPRVDPGPALRKGHRGERVAQLAARLQSGAPALGDVFDEDLDRLVRDFQSHHGLNPDGIAGAATIRELNVSAERRVEQLAANLERWRWMPDDLGDPHVMVNIAAFELKVVDRGQTRMTMKTVVGKQFTETPFFPAEIRSIVLNPYWNVPKKIADEELWPALRRDRTFFEREHIEVVPDGRLRQTPGPWNSLGRIKFDMPNRFTVYLHDTPARHLFAAETRTFSHGCIRVEKAFELATWLLRDRPEWTPDAIDAAIATGREKAIPLRTPVPVYVLYWTAFIADDGDLELRRDVYGPDAALIDALHLSQPVRSSLTRGQ
jgi:murein L,D-transpeptidase YcbB/YkuD